MVAIDDPPVPWGDKQQCAIAPQKSLEILADNLRNIFSDLTRLQPKFCCINSFEEAREALAVGRPRYGFGTIAHFKDMGLGRFYMAGWRMSFPFR